MAHTAFRHLSAVTVLRRLTVALFLLCIGLAGAGGFFVYRQVVRALPPIGRIVEYRPPVVTQVLATDGSLLAEFFSEKRYLVPIEHIPDLVRKAFLAAEDEGFYRHHGVQPISVVRALMSNLVAGGRVQGGSTITQQVVKQLLLTPEKSYERKLKEMILALRLEKRLSKDEILALYLNYIYLGSGAHGVAAAAREYFGKSVEDLNLSEAALLAGLPQAPSRYSPFRNWPEAKARQRYVLNRMATAGFITQEQGDAAYQQPLALATRKGNVLAAPYFVEHVRRMLEARYGAQALYEMGLRVQTTADPILQQTAEEAVRTGLESLTRRHHGYRSFFRDMTPKEGQLYFARQSKRVERAGLRADRSYNGLVMSTADAGIQVRVGTITARLIAADGETLPELRTGDRARVRVVVDTHGVTRFRFDATPPIEGALVGMDPHTGYVRALVGGYDFDRSQFNRATQARRQPGSAFKPLVYAAALDRNFTPASVIMDDEVCFDDHGHEWCPQNFSEKHYGLTTLRTALIHSRNIVTVKLANSIGVGYLVHYLERFGFSRPLAPNLSLALGSAEVSPLELATAYATFANQGRRPKPIFITEISDAGGRVLERHEPEMVDAIAPDTAYQITSMLQDVVRRGTGRRVRGLKLPTAGKTGTTNDFHDNWFVGFTPTMLAAVWVGFDSEQTLGPKETGGRNAGPIWKAFMEVATRDAPRAEFPMPSNLVCVNIDPETGLRALPGGQASLECFRPGTEPALGATGFPLVQPATGEADSGAEVQNFLRNDF